MTDGPEQSPGQQCANTDRHLWPLVSEEDFPDTIHVTASGGIGINCGGTVIVKTMREWHSLASRVEDLEAALDQLLDDMGNEGLSVCQAAKDQAIAVMASSNLAPPASEPPSME